MAVLAPFLILLAVGIIDIGRYTFVAVAVVNSACAGAENWLRIRVTIPVLTAA